MFMQWSADFLTDVCNACVPPSPSPSSDLYCTLEVDSYGYFVSKAKTRVFRDTAEPQWNEEFEIELEGSQYLRILCYEKCYDKSMLNKDDNEIVDKIMGKGQVQVRGRPPACDCF